MEGDINREGQNFSEGGFVKILAGGGIPAQSPPLGETMLLHICFCVVEDKKDSATAGHFKIDKQHK